MCLLSCTQPRNLVLSYTSMVTINNLMNRDYETYPISILDSIASGLVLLHHPIFTSFSSTILSIPTLILVPFICLRLAVVSIGYQQRILQKRIVWGRMGLVRWLSSTYPSPSCLIRGSLSPTPEAWSFNNMLIMFVKYERVCCILDPYPFCRGDVV